MALTAVFLHSGQVCSAGARLIVEESIHDEFVDELVAPGAARSASAVPSTRRRETGPLISAGPPATRSRRTSQPGSPRAPRCAAAATASRRRTSPTATSTCRPSSTTATRGMRVVQEESFGPVLTVETFSDRGRGRPRSPTTSIYGLAGAVWTQDAGRASGSRRGCAWARCGSTTTTPTSPQAEWGGYKQSGIGRELGSAGLEEYRETKHIWHNIAPARRRAGSAVMGHERLRQAQPTHEAGALGLRHRGWRLGRLRDRQPAQRRPGDVACWSSRRAAATSGSTRSSTCRRRCRSRSATGSTTGSTSPSPSRTWTAAGSTTPAARCSAAPAASTG